jgi:predicted ATP-binding protein involved in virulence
MAQTRRKRSVKRSGKRSVKRTGKRGGNHIRATGHAIKKWYEKMFEQLGWMILADQKGYTDKITSYKASLERLKDAIETKMQNVHESDRKEDLKIMHENLMILMSHVNKDFR